MSHVTRKSSACLMFLMLAPVACADTPAPKNSNDSPKPLSVAPLDHIEYPEDRPEWVSRSPSFDDDSFSIVVVSGPCDTADESIKELELMRRAAVSTFVSRFSESSGQYDFYPISDKEIDRQLVTRSYSGEVTQGDMTKYEHAVELRFSDEHRQQIRSAWKNVAVRERLGALGVTVFSGFVMLICSSGLIGVASRRVERRQREMEASL